MGHTTRISDYEWDRGDGPDDIPEGDVEVKAKVVAPKPKKAPVSTTRSVKDK